MDNSNLINNCSKSTVDDNELERFKALQKRWWSDKTSLHSLNKVRLPFVRGVLESENPKCWKNLKILDVGCGGGIFSEELAKLGAVVHGLDPGFESIEVAKQHAALNPSLTNLTYIMSTIEDHAARHSEEYDVVVASEVIEHVTEKEIFMEACIKCLKPNGSLVITTYNKTVSSWFFGVVLIQEMLNIIPRGVHSWNKFISLSDLKIMLEKYNCKTVEVQGIWYDLLSRSWTRSSSTSTNYALHAKKIVK